MLFNERSFAPAPLATLRFIPACCCYRFKKRQPNPLWLFLQAGMIRSETSQSVRQGGLTFAIERKNLRIMRYRLESGCGRMGLIFHKREEKVDANRVWGLELARTQITVRNVSAALRSGGERFYFSWPTPGQVHYLMIATRDEMRWRSLSLSKLEVHVASKYKVLSFLLARFLLATYSTRA